MGKPKLQPLKVQHMHRMDFQVILVINPMFKRNFNPIPEKSWTFKGSALTSGSSSSRANSLQKIHMNPLSACCFTVKGYEPANYSGKKPWPHCLRKGRSCWYRTVPTQSSTLQYCETVIRTWQRCLSLIPISKHQYSSWTTLLCPLGCH